MALRECLSCTTRYAVGLETCPHDDAPDAGNVDDGFDSDSNYADAVADATALGVTVPARASRAEIKTLRDAAEADAAPRQTVAQLRDEARQQGIPIPAGSNRADIEELLAGVYEAGF